MPNVAPLILTTGEPAGIGPDLCIHLSDYLVHQPVVLCGDIELLRQRAQLLGKPVLFHHESEPIEDSRSLAVRHVSTISPVHCGCLNVENVPYVINMLSLAASDTLDGKYAGVITAPIHKGIICEAGGELASFKGHTEFFAQQTRVKLPVMVLGNKSLKVALLTTHLPLKAVANAINTRLLRDVLTIIHQDMQRYFTSGRFPKIGVCGLNPHAGESGHMGREEIEIINPTLDALRTSGLLVSEALPADTLFVEQQMKHYDIIVAMYHDQGLPVVKSQGFGECVNMTFGLPIVRTSVDHGTALSLAGTDNMDCGSLKCAIEYAKKMTRF